MLHLLNSYQKLKNGECEKKSVNWQKHQVFYGKIKLS